MPSEDESKGPLIEVTPNGPVKISNLVNFFNSRGERIPAAQTLWLCRCGGSQNKPFCDGQHTKIGFSGEKAKDRIKDKWHKFAGKKIIVHDNRGICSHSGVCTRNLSSVFNTGARPWINADGADVDAIIDVVKRCPSGALRYSLEREEYKDFARQPAIAIEKNGPLNVTGGIEFRDDQGNKPGSEEHYSLCRCGASKNKPFCDGTHSAIKFTDEKN